jgi:hypothetical protein
MFVSELWRIRGELLARERGGDIALAERSLDCALASGDAPAIEGGYCSGEPLRRARPL